MLNEIISNEPQRYIINIWDTEKISDIDKARYTIQNTDNEVTKFKGPATSNNFKIYIVGNKKSDNKECVVHYVGMTRQAIGTRMTQGLRPPKYGYGWRTVRGDHTLIVWTFGDNNITERDAQTVEAEIVYLIREQYGKWPQYQTEIHFHNAEGEQQCVAKCILSKSERIINETT